MKAARVPLLCSLVVFACNGGGSDGDSAGDATDDATGGGNTGVSDGSEGMAGETTATGDPSDDTPADDGDASSVGSSGGPEGGCPGDDDDRTADGAVDVAAGDNHTCAVLEDGAVRCWGLGASGQLGYGNTESIGDDETPACAGDIDLGGRAVQVAAGGLHTCALLDTGTVRCWGWGHHGQLGYGSTESIGDDETPAQAGDVELGGVGVQITAGGVHTCAVLDTGTVRCWGFGEYGRLGYGNVESIGDDESPAQAGDVDLGGAVVQIDAGGSHTCAVVDTAAVRCWGFGNNAQLGYGYGYAFGFAVGDDETPASVGDVKTVLNGVPDSGSPLTQVAAGSVFTCAVRTCDGAPRPTCWGQADSGQGGYHGSHFDASLCWLDSLSNAVRVDAGGQHTCALLPAGAVSCLGGSAYGQLGQPDLYMKSTSDPVEVDVGGSVTKIATGADHTCALLDTGAVRCWGLGANGRLGYGSVDNVGDDETPADAGDVPL